MGSCVCLFTLCVYNNTFWYGVDLKYCCDIKQLAQDPLHYR